MKRVAKTKEVAHLKPVNKIEVSEKHLKLRIVIFSLFLIIGVVAIIIGVSSYLAPKKGWQLVSSSSIKVDCSDDFILYYNFTGSNATNKADNTNLAKVYSAACENAYYLFNNDVEYEGLNNIYYINRHPNEDIIVDYSLYNAFKKINEYNNRSIFYGGIYELYSNLYNALDDVSASNYDPWYNSSLKDFFTLLCPLLSDSNYINLEIKDDYTIRLNVDNQLITLFNEYELKDYLNFTYLKNAFILDYIYDLLIAYKLDKFQISSIDGYYRSSNVDSTMSLTTTNGYLLYDNQISLICYNKYTLNNYIYSNNIIANYYLNLSDGLYYQNNETMYVYDYNNAPVSSLMLATINSYLIDKIIPENLFKEITNYNFLAFYENKVYSNDINIKYIDYNNKEIEVLNLG